MYMLNDNEILQKSMENYWYHRKILIAIPFTSDNFNDNPNCFEYKKGFTNSGE